MSNSLNNLAQFVRESSAEQLKAFGAIELAEVKRGISSTTNAVPGELWTAYMLITGHVLDIKLRTHYTRETAAYLASYRFGIEPEVVRTDQQHDFMKEIGNLWAGAIKRSLLANDLSVSMSLPTVSFGKHLAMKNESSQIRGEGLMISESREEWEVKLDKFPIACSAWIGVYGDLPDPLKLSHAQGSGMDFL